MSISSTVKRFSAAVAVVAAIGVACSDDDSQDKTTEPVTDTSAQPSTTTTTYENQTDMYRQRTLDQGPVATDVGCAARNRRIRDVAKKLNQESIQLAEEQLAAGEPVTANVLRGLAVEAATPRKSNPTRVRDRQQLIKLHPNLVAGSVQSVLFDEETGQARINYVDIEGNARDVGLDVWIEKDGTIKHTDDELVEVAYYLQQNDVIAALSTDQIWIRSTDEGDEIRTDERIVPTTLTSSRLAGAPFLTDFADLPVPDALSAYSKIVAAGSRSNRHYFASPDNFPALVCLQHEKLADF